MFVEYITTFLEPLGRAMPEGEPEKENPLGDVNAARTLASGVHFSCCGKGGVRGHLKARRWGGRRKGKKTLPVDPLHPTRSSGRARPCFWAECI